MLFDGHWKMKAQYVVKEQKHDIFNFPSKNLEASGDSFYYEIVCLGFYISSNYLYLTQKFVLKEARCNICM